MDPAKKNAVRELADGFAVYGEAAFRIYDAEPDDIRALILHAERIRLQKAWLIACGISLQFSDPLPEALFEALASDPDQARREYRRYLADRALDRRAADLGI